MNKIEVGDSETGESMGFFSTDPRQFGHVPTFASIDVDVVHAAIHALTLALGYMPQIQTDVPQWKRALAIDINAMQTALDRLKYFRDVPGLVSATSAESKGEA